MREKHDGLSHERVEALLGSVRERWKWTEEEVLKFAHEEHLLGEQIFNYCAAPEAEPLRELVEAHVAKCAFCHYQLDAIWRLTTWGKTQIFRRTPDLAHYKEIVDIDRIVQLSTELEQRLLNGLPHREYRSIHFIPNHTYFQDSTGEDVFWWSGRKWPNGSFHHLFGHGTPGGHDGLHADFEFNVLIAPPFRRKLGGAFLQDMTGKICLAHRGIVTINVQGGRVSKKQFFEAMAQVDAEFTHDESFVLIAEIESDNLIDEIEAFARKAREAKANLVNALGRP